LAEYMPVETRKRRAETLETAIFLAAARIARTSRRMSCVLMSCLMVVIVSWHTLESIYAPLHLAQAPFYISGDSSRGRGDFSATHMAGLRMIAGCQPALLCRGCHAHSLWKPPSVRSGLYTGKGL